MVNFIGKLFRLTGESWSLQLVNNQSKNISEVLDQKEKTFRLVMFKKLSHWPQVLVPALAPWGPPPSPPRCSSSAPT